MNFNRNMKITYFIKTLLTFMAIHSFVIGYMFYRESSLMSIFLSFAVMLMISCIVFFAYYRKADYNLVDTNMNFLFFGFTLFGAFLTYSGDIKSYFYWFSFYVAGMTVLFIVNMYLSSELDDYVKNHKTNSESYSVEIKASRKLVFAYVGVIAMLVLTVCVIQFSGLGTMINRLMRRLFHFSTGESEHAYTPLEPVEEDVIDEEVVVRDIEKVEEAGSSMWLIKLLLTIIIISIILLVAYIVIKAIITRFDDYFRSKRRLEVEEVELGVVVSMNNLEKSRKKEKLSGLFVRDPRKQVRTQFIKAVKLKRKRTIKLSMVPVELIDEQNSTGPEAELRALYEKAKYSDNTITKDEANRAKECFAAIKKTY